MNKDGSSNRWEHFSHDADVGIRGIGKTVGKAFEMAALALTSVITNPDTVNPFSEVFVHCKEPDIELLFLDWMNALIYEMDTRQMVFSQFHVQIDDDVLKTKVWGEKVNVNTHDPAVEIKGATMTELKVTKSSDHWMAQCVVDV